MGLSSRHDEGQIAAFLGQGVTDCDHEAAPGMTAARCATRGERRGVHPRHGLPVGCTTRLGLVSRPRQPGRQKSIQES